MTSASDRWAEVGAIIRLGMDRKAYSQAELSRAAEVSDTKLRALMRGEEGNYRRSTLAKIGMALFENPMALLSVIEEEPPPAGFDTWLDAYLGKPTPPTPPGGAAALDPDVIGLAARAGKLTPEERAKVDAFVQGLLAARES